MKKKYEKMKERMKELEMTQVIYRPETMEAKKMKKLKMCRIGKLPVLVAEGCEPVSKQRKQIEIQQHKIKAEVQMIQGLYYEAFREHIIAYAFYGAKIMTPEQIKKATEELIEEGYLGPVVTFSKYEIAQAMLEHAGLEKEASELEEKVAEEKAEHGGFKRGLEQCLYKRMYWHRLL